VWPGRWIRGPSIYDVHTDEGRGVQPEMDVCGGRGQSHYDVCREKYFLVVLVHFTKMTDYFAAGHVTQSQPAVSTAVL